jgi:hypothetical protein
MSDSSATEQAVAEPMSTRHPQQLLRVEVYSHGGWWKDSTGRTGQISPDQSSKGPMATVAAVANSFGVGGWQLTDMVSAHHNTYMLSFSLAAPSQETSPPAGSPPSLRRTVSTNLG